MHYRVDLVNVSYMNTSFPLTTYFGVDVKLVKDEQAHTKKLQGYIEASWDDVAFVLEDLVSFDRLSTEYINKHLGDEDQAKLVSSILKAYRVIHKLEGL